MFFLVCLKVLKDLFVFWVCFGLYIDALNVSMRFSVIFCIYEHIRKDILGYIRTSIEQVEHFEIPKTCFLLFFV